MIYHKYNICHYRYQGIHVSSKLGSIDDTVGIFIMVIVCGCIVRGMACSRAKRGQEG